MSLLNPKELKKAAERSLDAAAYSPKKLALIHGALSAAALLIISLLDLLLSQQIGATGGLSGMGARAMLSTVQSTLSLGLSIAMPFWEMGLLYACLQFSRKEDVSTSSLAEGFRRFGPLLRLMLLEAAICGAVGILAANISSFIFMMTPLSYGFITAAQTIPMEELTVESMMPLMKAAIPLYLIMAAVLLILLIPIIYRFRMAGFYLLSNGHRRALAALGVSNRITAGNRFSLFKLDLSFWWYYGGIFLLTFIANADVIFGLPNWASYVFYLVYLAGQVLLSWQAAAYVQTTYAHAFDTLMSNDDGEKPLVRNFPWGFLPDAE